MPAAPCAIYVHACHLCMPLQRQALHVHACHLCPLSAMRYMSMHVIYACTPPLGPPETETWPETAYYAHIFCQTWHRAIQKMCKQTVIFSDNLITTFNQLATQYAPLRPRFVAGGLYSRSGPSKLIGEREALDRGCSIEAPSKAPSANLRRLTAGIPSMPCLAKYVSVPRGTRQPSL